MWKNRVRARLGLPAVVALLAVAGCARGGLSEGVGRPGSPSLTSDASGDDAPDTGAGGENDVWPDEDAVADTTTDVPVEAVPCIRVNHEDGLSFGARRLGTTAEEEVTITNCSEGAVVADLIIELVARTDRFPATRDAFAVTLPAAWGTPIDWPIVLEAGETETFIVSYTPTQLSGTDRAELQIVSNDASKSPMIIELDGTGSTNECPTAVASCVVRGSGAAPSSELAVRPLDTLDCTAAGSSDLEGPIVAYQWEVLLAPSGSNTRFESATAERSSFLVDHAGTYRLQLNVFDDAGAPACRPAIIDVLATPDHDIHIVLVWETPGDRNRFDTGSGAGADLDLHFLHPNGTWCDRTWDCHFRNRRPNWGSLDPTADDNPSMDTDRVDGWGPEIINMRNPESNVPYRVGVTYYNDHGYGFSDATVRIYLQGLLVWTGTRRLERTGEFWEVATIDWPSMVVTAIDSVTPTVPRPNACD